MLPILSIADLQYAYPNGTQALDGVTLAVHAGERIAVLGSNGSGKSTLFLCLNGVLRAQSGEIRFDGKPYSYNKKGLIEIRRNIGIVFQDPEMQLFCVDVFQEVAFGPYNLGMRKDALEQVVAESLDSLDLTPMRELPPHFLSCGQKKRVSIAAVLAMKPQVLIFDEPTAALDPLHARQMLALLETFSQQGMTILMSTHDVDLTHAWADRVVVMGHGKVCGDGTPEAIFSDHALLAQNDLCAPAVLQLFDKLTACGMLPQGLVPPKNIERLSQYLDDRGREDGL